KSGVVKVRDDACKADETKVVLLDADEKMVADCKYLGDLYATSGWGGVMAGTGMGRAQKSIRRQAAEKGATHVVWATSVSGGGGSPAVTGGAYKCEAGNP